MNDSTAELESTIETATEAADDERKEQQAAAVAGADAISGEGQEGGEDRQENSDQTIIYSRRDPYLPEYYRANVRECLQAFNSLGKDFYAYGLFCYALFHKFCVYGPMSDEKGRFNPFAFWDEKHKPRIKIKNDDEMREVFEELCVDFSVGVEKSHTVMVSKKEASSKGGLKTQAKQRAAKEAAKKEEDIIPADVQRVDAIIEKYKSYKPMTLGEATRFLKNLDKEGSGHALFLDYSSSDFIDNYLCEHFSLPSDSVIEQLWEETKHEVKWGGKTLTLISKDEEKWLLFFECCEQGWGVRYKKAIVTYDGFRTETDGHCALLSMFDEVGEPYGSDYFDKVVEQMLIHDENGCYWVHDEEKRVFRHIMPK